MTVLIRFAARLSLAAATILFSASVFADHPYLDDANKRQPSVDTSVPSLNHDFPRTLSHEFSGNASNEDISKYHFIDTHGVSFPNVESIQNNYSPETMVLRHISGRAYQGYNASYCYISSGIGFETTTAASQGGPENTGCGIYAGHWLYKAGVLTTAHLGSTATTISVANANNFDNGQYVVIYDAPAGSFKNAEHARITNVNKSTNKLTVVRGYKSTKKAHPTGSIVAQHVLGQGPDPKLWAFNQSSKSPRDANGKTFGEFYADWIAKNLKRYKKGTTSTADISGVMFDADFYFDLLTSEVDANNDLTTDDGLSANGVNWLGDGLDSFYARVKSKLPGKYVLVGVHRGRGIQSAYGAQIESWIDYGNGDFNPNPIYSKLSEMIAYYLFHMSEHNNGPALVHNLSKTPTKEYPGSHGAGADSNAPARLALTTTLIEDGYFGTHSNAHPDAWWDEYAVDVVPGSPNYGKAINKNNENAIRNHRGWLGQPVGKFKRIYNDTDYNASKNLLANSTFDSNANNWKTGNVSISRVTTNTMDGAGALRISEMNTYKSAITGAWIKSETLSVTKNQPYTVAFSMRADSVRDVRLALGGATSKVPVSTKWRRYVVTMTPTSTGTSALKFNLGVESVRTYLDSVYLFRGDTNVFRREFDNGLALANATASSKTISVGSGYQRIDGTQDPINNGNSLTSITLAPYDGIVLVRKEGTSSGGGGGGGGGGGTGGGSGQIGDFVWSDDNGDGIQSVGEDGWPNATVNLRECNGPIIDTTTTNSSGVYSFQNLGPGSYQIEVPLPLNAEYSPSQAGANSASSDVDPATGLTWCPEITAAGENRGSLDAGLIPTAPPTGTGSIGDFVWSDDDGDGIQSAGEDGWPNATVNLRQCNGPIIATTTTNANGNYSFQNLAAGSYQVEVPLPANAEYSPMQAGANSSSSDIDPATGLSWCPDISAAGENRRSIDAGLIPAAAPPSGSGSIGDFVWSDDDGDGIQSAGEAGWINATVNLRQCNGPVLATTTTDSNGNYSFDNLGAGSYQVEFPLPADAEYSPMQAGPNATSSDVDPATGLSWCPDITAAGEDRRSIDAGFVPTAAPPSGTGSIGDFVWSDDNGDGIQSAGEAGWINATVNLRQCNGPVIDTTTTDSNGNYSFDNLGAGSYQVEFPLPANAEYSPMQAGPNATSSDVDPATGLSWCPDITAAGESRQSIDAGFIPAAPATGTSSIGDYVWNDENRNGIQGGAEGGLSGVKIKLRDCNRVYIKTVFSGANGRYEFANLPAGDYIVEFVAPAGATQSPAKVGSDNSDDSNPDASGFTGCLSLGDFDQRNRVDAGFYF